MKNICMQCHLAENWRNAFTGVSNIIHVSYKQKVNSASYSKILLYYSKLDSFSLVLKKLVDIAITGFKINKITPVY